MTQNTRAWLRGLIASAINAASSAVILIIADPSTFNFQSPTKLLLTTAAFTALAVANYLKQHPLPEETVEVKTTITHTGGPTNAALALIVAGSLVLGAPACASKYGGAVSTNPTVSQIDATRELAIKIASGVEIGANIGVQALRVADSLEKGKVISPAVLARIATAASAFGKVADGTLKRLETVASRPELTATVRALFAELDPLLAALDASGNDTLKTLATSLRIATTVARTVL